MKNRCLLTAALISALASAASAQVIYEPLVTQFGGQNPYDYAGCDPQVHVAAVYPGMDGASYGRGNGFAYVSSRRAVVERRPRAFADYLGPHGNPLTDLTPADVINAAHARLPRYFRKADLLAAVQNDPAPRIEPRNRPNASAGSIIIIRRGPTTRPARG